MKLIVSLFLIVFSANAIAAGGLVIETGKGPVEIEWLGSDVDDSKVDLAREYGGQTALLDGKACFKGKRKDAIQVLNHLGLNKFMGDEYRIQNTHNVGPDRLSYEIYDRPNKIIASQPVIGACESASLEISCKSANKVSLKGSLSAVKGTLALDDPQGELGLHDLTPLPSDFEFLRYNRVDEAKYGFARFVSDATAWESFDVSLPKKVLSGEQTGSFPLYLTVYFDDGNKVVPDEARILRCKTQ